MKPVYVGESNTTVKAFGEKSDHWIRERIKQLREQGKSKEQATKIANRQGKLDTKSIESEKATLVDKRQQIVAEANSRLKDKVRAVGPEKHSQMIAELVERHGKVNRRIIAAALPLRSEDIDRAIEHGEGSGLFRTERTRAHPNGSGPLTTWVYSKAFKIGERTISTDAGHTIHDEFEEYGLHSYREAAKQSREATVNADTHSRRAAYTGPNGQAAYTLSQEALRASYAGDHLVASEKHRDALDKHKDALRQIAIKKSVSYRDHTKAVRLHSEAAKMHETTHAIREHRKSVALED